MVMRLSTSPIMLLTIIVMMANTPMMNSERKMVTTAPMLVPTLRVRWLPASRRE